METITKKRLSTSTGLPMLKPMSKRQMVKKFKKYENKKIEKNETTKGGKNE